MDLEAYSGSELTSLLLAEMRRRSAAVTPSTVLARLDDRFTRSSAASPAAIRRIETVLAAHLPDGAEELGLAPLAPFAAHAAVADVDQNRVVSTTRGNEVAADPTLVLAVEAARRRRRRLDADPKDAHMLHLAAFQRVTRAQVFEGPRSFAHFAVSGLVTAGRDIGDREFERRALETHIAHLAVALPALGCQHVEILVTDFTDGSLGPMVDELSRRWSGGRVAVEAYPDRTRAQNYYTDLAIEAHVVVDDEGFEIGDGGMVDWTQRLVASKKERAMISGLGVERLALALG